jgi:hypothetical protein
VSSPFITQAGLAKVAVCVLARRLTHSASISAVQARGVVVGVLAHDVLHLPHGERALAVADQRPSLASVVLRAQRPAARTSDEGTEGHAGEKGSDRVHAQVSFIWRQSLECFGVLFRVGVAPGFAEGPVRLRRTRDQH